MALSVEQINSKASAMTIAGWFAGLAWVAYSGPDLSWWAWAILIVVGMFAASVIIGGGIALLMGILTKAITGNAEGSPHGYAWGAFISPVIAFFCAPIAAGWFA